ncbi:MAG: LuxR C-terminal-related transcriptional regulator [Ginsengibacter sp.]
MSDLAPDTFTRVQLTRLSTQAVYRLADEKGYDAEKVFSISGGNPFYVNEIVASYSPGVPDNIKDAVTNRELDVLQLFKKAVQNEEIAETLFISHKTVDHHISSILFKLDVNSRSKAVSEAVRLGILK